MNQQDALNNTYNEDRIEEGMNNRVRLARICSKKLSEWKPRRRHSMEEKQAVEDHTEHLNTPLFERQIKISKWSHFVDSGEAHSMGEQQAVEGHTKHLSTPLIVSREDESVEEHKAVEDHTNLEKEEDRTELQNIILDVLWGTSGDWWDRNEILFLFIPLIGQWIQPAKKR